MESRRKRTSLDPEFLLEAYVAGFFPMADPETGEISWYSPDPRAILPIDGVPVFRSLRRSLQSGFFDFRMDGAFEEVIRRCGRRDKTWISEEIITAYKELHRLGLAHSIEAWHQGSLVGGLYGVSIGGAFFGESMFSSTPNASKAALVVLSDALKSGGFLLHDIQFLTEHLARFGAREIPRKQYLDLLSRAVGTRARLRLPETG